MESKKRWGDSQTLKLSKGQHFLNYENEIPRDNTETTNDMEISSEFSFTSGYRSSELLSDQSSEDLEEELGEITLCQEILEDIVDEVISSNEKKISLGQKTKRSILKSVRHDRDERYGKWLQKAEPGDALPLQSPTLEELPDLESIKTKTTSFSSIERTHSQKFYLSRKVIFIDQNEKILAASAHEEDNSMPIIRMVPRDFDGGETLMRRLHALSETLHQHTQCLSSQVTFVDVSGRVLATSKVKSPTEVRRKVSSSPRKAEVWLQLRKLSRDMETRKSSSSGVVSPN